jgi:integral membrane protein (TIGR01906 family)
MSDKITKKLAEIPFVICLPLLLISMNVLFVVSHQALYEYGFTRYDVEASTGIEDQELNRAAGELIEYFKGRSDTAQIVVTRDQQQIDLFTERELIHLKDVKDIIGFFRTLFWITAGYAATWIILGVIIRRKAFLKPIMRGLFTGGILTLALMAVLGIWALIDFDSLFLRFHLSSFSNDYWQLPASSYLLRMFPEGFFSDAAFLLVADITVTCLVLIGPAWFYLRRHPACQLHEEQLPDEQLAHDPPPPTGMDAPLESLENDANEDTNRFAP